MAYIPDKAILFQQSMSELRAMDWNQSHEKSKASILSHGHTSNTLAKNKDEKKANVYLEYKIRWLRWDTL